MGFNPGDKDPAFVLKAFLAAFELDMALFPEDTGDRYLGSGEFISLDFKISS